MGASRRFIVIRRAFLLFSVYCILRIRKTSSVARDHFYALPLRDLAWFIRCAQVMIPVATIRPHLLGKKIKLKSVSGSA
jgi:hypothetical protein